VAVLRRVVLRALDVVLRAEVEARLRAVPAARDVVLRAVPAAFEVVLRAWLVPLPLLVLAVWLPLLVLAVWPVVVLSVVAMLITPLP
jgi:hypothetical protein